MKMWPYNPGDRWRRGHITKKGTTVNASSCRVYHVSTKFSMYTSRCVVVYSNTHDYISVRRVCKHVPVARSYSCVNRSDVGRWRSRTCWVMLYRATVVGRGWTGCPRTCGCLSNDHHHGVCRLCCAEQVELKRSAFNMFSTDTFLSNGLIWKIWCCWQHELHWKSSRRHQLMVCHSD
jgi:hypothetical protein